MRAEACSSLRDRKHLTALIEVRDRILNAIRVFFRTRGYREVYTPVLVDCPGLDHYVEALPAGRGKYLATSPELHMKRLVCNGARLIYQITPAFRSDETGAHHTTEFLMLEWYHCGIGYLEMMQETEELLIHLTNSCDYEPVVPDEGIPRMAVDQLYELIAGWRPSQDWNEDRYFADWVGLIEPHLQTLPAVILQDFPKALAALSEISPTNNLVCERFELFLHGLEVCNAYTELTDYQAHCNRFKESIQHREKLGLTSYGVDERFLEAVGKGMPACAGNAMGIDRLLMALTGAQHIDEVRLFPEDQSNS